MKPAPEKPALRVIEGYKGPPLPRRPKLPTDGELILPPIKLPWKEVFSTWLGMTSRQANPAFYQVAAIDGEKAAAAITRLSDAIVELEEALTAHHEVLLMGMMQCYPAAARRIMKKLQRAAGS